MKRKNCRSCGSTHLNLIFDFGLQPLAGCFPNEPMRLKPCATYPLDLTQCSSCGLLMTTNLPPIDEVFNADYKYSSSTIPTLVSHFSAYSLFLCEWLSAGANVLEFGCNDGILLDFLSPLGFDCVGVDASENMVKIATIKGHNVIGGFFGETLVINNNLVASQDLITCSNVLAHIDDLSDVLKAVHLALKNNGLFCIEVHDAEALIAQNQFDTVYHEHLTYFSIDTLHKMLRANKFSQVFKEHTNMHGGGLRVVYKKTSHAQVHQPTDVGLFIGLGFKQVIKRCQNDIQNIFLEHGLIDGYGAAGRSQMFLNVTSTADYFSCVFDDSKFRQNKFIAGTNLRIKEFGLPSSEVCIILAWNYSDSILKNINNSYDKIYTILPELKKLK
jgi:SAM-dependent methyltransferase